MSGGGRRRERQMGGGRKNVASIQLRSLPGFSLRWMFKRSADKQFSLIKGISDVRLQPGSPAPHPLCCKEERSKK